jgi:hypothetical protein
MYLKKIFAPTSEEIIPHFLAPKQNGSASRVILAPKKKCILFFDGDQNIRGESFHNITKYVYKEFLLLKSHFIYSNTYIQIHKS